MLMKEEVCMLRSTCLIIKGVYTRTCTSFFSNILITVKVLKKNNTNRQEKELNGDNCFLCVADCYVLLACPPVTLPSAGSVGTSTSPSGDCANLIKISKQI